MEETKKSLEEILASEPNNITIIPEAIIEEACNQLGLSDSSIKTALLKAHTLLQEVTDDPTTRANYIEDITRLLEHIKVLSVYYENKVNLLKAKYYPPKEKGMTEQDRKNIVDIELYNFRLLRDILSVYSELLEKKVEAERSLLSFEKTMKV